MNHVASERDCEELFNSLHEKIHEKLVQNEYRDYKSLGADYELLRKYYKENARGSAKYEIGEQMVGTKLYENSEHFVYMMRLESEKEYNEKNNS